MIAKLLRKLYTALHLAIAGVRQSGSNYTQKMPYVSSTPSLTEEDKKAYHETVECKYGIKQGGFSSFH